MDYANIQLWVICAGAQNFGPGSAVLGSRKLECFL